MKVVSIEAETIASAWSSLINIIATQGDEHKPDYKTTTKRVHATITINNVYDNQVSEYVPFGDNLMKEYKNEMTENYAKWYVNLPDEDKRKFEYCYAKQLFLYGSEQYNSVRRNIESLRVGSRRHVGVLWENEVHIEKYEDQPCWIAYKLEQTNEEEIILYVLYRSWDAFGGLPANIPAIVDGIQAMLNKYSGKTLRIGQLICTGWDTHIYETDLDAVRKILRESHFCKYCNCLKPKYTLQPTAKGYKCQDCLSS